MIKTKVKGEKVVKPGNMGQYPAGLLVAKSNLKTSKTDFLYIEQTGPEKFETFIFNGNEKGLTVYHGIYPTIEEAQKHYQALKEYF